MQIGVAYFQKTRFTFINVGGLALDHLKDMAITDH